jgi:hypothetical protein
MLDQQSRAVRTRDNARRGILPAPVRHHAVEGIGDGQRCDGCGELIHPATKLSIVTVRNWLPLWFHHDCYRAWLMCMS